FSQFNSALHTPEEIRTQRDKPMRRIPVSNTAHEAVDAKNFLQHDDTWSIPTRRQGKIAVELAAIERLDCNHGSTDYTDSSNTDNNPCKSGLNQSVKSVAQFSLTHSLPAVQTLRKL